jgi:hypothetical protein
LTKFYSLYKICGLDAEMAKLVDAPASGAGGGQPRGGSSPLLGIIIDFTCLIFNLYFYLHLHLWGVVENAQAYHWVQIGRVAAVVSFN